MFSEFLLGVGVDPQDWEPDEITWLCEDSVFRAIADYCARSRGWQPPDSKPFETFDADELGIDPEDA